LDAEKYIHFLHRKKRVISEEVQSAVDAINFFFREALRKDIRASIPFTALPTGR
jgi:hypothetical protein